MPPNGRGKPAMPASVRKPPENYDPIIEDLVLWDTASTVMYDWPMIREITDAELSASGEARHRTIGGRGVVGRLVDRG